PLWTLPAACLLCADPSLPRPSISLSPTGVTAPGADVTIWCQGQRRDVRFFLHKAGDLNPQRHMDPAGAGAEFHIPTVGQQHGGNYSCSYRPQSEPFVSSQPSDTVELVVAGREFTKPTIWVSPSREVLLGTAVTIRCWGQHPGVQFVLNKEGRHFPPADSDGLEVEFSTNNVHRDLGGSYTCSCHSRSEPFAVSYPSDPMELVVRGEGPGSASPFPAPPSARPSWGLGANETLRARLCPEKTRRTETEQVGTWILPIPMDLPGSQGSWVLSPALGGGSEGLGARTPQT
uniref:Immunoglobulin domain-containing protein n=1 Tax=Chelonoidis abingdonii TaxID=106734 RepID=A0A8C0GWY5_CHEAB